jgi:hypothetical protein
MPWLCPPEVLRRRQRKVCQINGLAPVQEAIHLLATNNTASAMVYADIGVSSPPRNRCAFSLSGSEHASRGARSPGTMQSRDGWIVLDRPGSSTSPDVAVAWLLCVARQGSKEVIGLFTARDIIKKLNKHQDKTVALK